MSESDETLELETMIKKLSVLPKIVVFDLDYTLWPYHVDSTIDLPIKKAKDGGVTDARGMRLRLYPDVVQILELLKENGILMAAASRTCAPPAAQDMLNYFNIDKYFSYKEIYPGEKSIHFQRISKNSKIAYDDMLFFDDEKRNITTVSKLNVTCFLVRKEMNMKTLLEGLALLAEQHKS